MALITTLCLLPTVDLNQSAQDRALRTTLGLCKSGLADMMQQIGFLKLYV